MHAKLILWKIKFLFANIENSNFTEKNLQYKEQSFVKWKMYDQYRLFKYPFEDITEKMITSSTQAQERSRNKAPKLRRQQLETKTFFALQVEKQKCLFILSYMICITIQLLMFKDLLIRLREELQIEKQRYYRDRWGKIAAAMIYALAFNAVPLILKEIIPRLTQLMRPEYAYILITLSTLNIVAILFNAAMAFIYRSKIPFFEQYRNNPDKPWPWETDAIAWDKLRWRSIWKTAVCINIVGGLSLVGEVLLDFTIVMDVEKRMQIGRILLQFFLMMLAEDLFFFSTHFALHQPYLYPFHKIHHEYTNTVSLAGLHFHPLEFFITQSISTLFSIKLASLVGPMNISTLVIWLIFRMLDAFYGHSGYNFSWTPLQLLPFATYDDFHDFHHSSNNGNYGSHFRFWDSLFGTINTFRKHKQGLRIKTK